MNKLAIWMSVPALVAALAVAPTPAAAEVAEDSGEVEIYAGWYSPGPSEADAAVSYGLRFGYNFGRRAGIQGSIGRTELDVDEFDVEAWALDISWEWHVNPDGRGVFLLYAGPGWASFDADGSGGSDDSFSVHFGFGGKIAVRPSFYLRPDARVRWFENRDEDEFDFEVTFALGWTIGAN